MAGREPITTTNVTAPINVVYQRRLLDKAEIFCPYFMGTTAATISEREGSFTAKWRRYNDITPSTTALSELSASSDISFGMGRTSVQITITELTATLAKYGQYMTLNEEVDLINITPTSAQLVDVLGRAAGMSLNRLQRNEHEDNATAYLAGGATSIGTTSDAIKLVDIETVVDWLETTNTGKFTALSGGSSNFNTTPIPECFYGITHPHVSYDLRRMTGFRPVESYAAHTETLPREVGMVNRVRFIETTESTIDTNTGASSSGSTQRGAGTKIDIYNTVIFGENAFGSVGLGTEHVKDTYMAGDKLPGVMMFQWARSHSMGDPFAEIAGFGYKTWHAAKVLSPTTSNVTDWCRVIRSGASKIA